VQSGDDPVNRDMADGKLFGQIARSADTFLVQNIRHRFHVVLGSLFGMIVSCAAKRVLGLAGWM
jgi:hypothetical protein